MNLTKEQKEKYGKMNLEELLKLVSIDDEAKQFACEFGVEIAGHLYLTQVKHAVKKLTENYNDHLENLHTAIKHQPIIVHSNFEGLNYDRKNLKITAD